MVTDVVLMFIVTSTIVFFLAIARMLYKSKCRTVRCCGCEIDRDVQIEQEEEHERIQHDENAV
jgi:hypothetical protein